MKTGIAVALLGSLAVRRARSRRLKNFRRSQAAKFLCAYLKQFEPDGSKKQ